MNALSNTCGDQQHGADTAREQLVRCCTFYPAPYAIAGARSHGNRPIEQRRQNIGQHLCGHIHQRGMLAQLAHTLEPQSVLEVLERLLDAPAAVVKIGQIRRRGHIPGQRRRQHPRAPDGVDVVHQTSAHARRTIELPGAGLLHIAGRERAPTFASPSAQKAARSALARGAVATNHEVDTALGEHLHQSGGRVTSIQNQHIAPAQTIELVKEHLTFVLKLAVHGHVQHQIIGRQVQSQGALIGGGQRAGAQTDALGGSEERAIGAEHAADIGQMQLAPAFYGIDQAVIERTQGGHMQLGAGLGQGAVRDQNGSTVGAQAGEEGVELALHVGATKARQGAQKCGQGQLAGAGERLGVSGAAGHLGEGRAVQEIREIGQKKLSKITVLGQKSCRPQEEIKQNRRLTISLTLSSVNCYREGLKDVKGIRCLPQTASRTRNHSYFPILVDDEHSLDRDGLYQKLKNQGINGRWYFYQLISEFSMYRGLSSSALGNLSIANYAAQRVLCLPIYPGLDSESQQRIIRLFTR